MKQLKLRWISWLRCKMRKNENWVPHKYFFFFEEMGGGVEGRPQHIYIPQRLSGRKGIKEERGKRRWKWVWSGSTRKDGSTKLYVGPPIVGESGRKGEKYLVWGFLIFSSLSPPLSPPPYYIYLNLQGQNKRVRLDASENEPPHAGLSADTSSPSSSDTTSVPTSTAAPSPLPTPPSLPSISTTTTNSVGNVEGSAVATGSSGSNNDHNKDHNNDHDNDHNNEHENSHNNTTTNITNHTKSAAQPKRVWIQNSVVKIVTNNYQISIPGVYQNSRDKSSYTLILVVLWYLFFFSGNDIL